MIHRRAKLADYFRLSIRQISTGGCYIVFDGNSVNAANEAGELRGAIEDENIEYSIFCLSHGDQDT